MASRNLSSSGAGGFFLLRWPWMRNNQHQQTLSGEGRLAADDLMMQYLHCQRAMASWIPKSRSNSFLKNVHRFTVGGNMLNFPWFLPWNPKESTRCPTSKPQDLAMFLPLCLYNHYFSDFSNPPKTKKSQGAFPSPPASPPKNGPVFLTKGAFGTSPLRLCLGSTLQCPCAATLGVKGGGRSNVAAGRGTPCGAKVGVGCWCCGTRGFIT